MTSKTTYNPIQNKNLKLYCDSFKNLPIELTNIIYNFVKNPFTESPTANIIKRLNKLNFTITLNDPVTVKNLEKELQITFLNKNNKISPVMKHYRLITRTSINSQNVIRKYK